MAQRMRYRIIPKVMMFGDGIRWHGGAQYEGEPAPERSGTVRLYHPADPTRYLDLPRELLEELVS